MSWGRTTPEQEPKSIRDLADQPGRWEPRPGYEFPTPRDTDQEDQ